MRRRIRDDVESGAQKQQREYFLRKQMDSIRKELGEDEGNVVEEYRNKIAEAGMPDEVREQAERELGRLERMGDSSGESSMIRSYLDWLLAVPWSKTSRRSTEGPREILDATRRPRGREGARDRYLAVRSSGGRASRGQALGAILTLIDRPARARRRSANHRTRSTASSAMSLGGGVTRRDPRPPAHVHRCAPGRLVARSATRER